MDFYTNVARHRNQLLVRGYKDGKRYKNKINYRPYLFLPSKIDDPIYRSYDGRPVEKIEFASMFEANKFCRDYEDVAGFDVYGMNNFQYVYLYDEYVSKGIEFEPGLIKTCVLDIETRMGTSKPDIESANQEITAITLMYRDITFVFSYSDFKTDDPTIKYVKCKDEESLLRKFLSVWSHDVYSPDVVTGWYIEFFDIPYLINRIAKILGIEDARRMSPWGILEEKRIMSHGKESVTYIPYGISVLDYIALYKKFVQKEQPSYSLNAIAQEELNEKKVDYSEYGNLDDLYEKNPQLYLEYNIHDCRLIYLLDDKMGFLELVYTFAYDSGINFNDALTSVRAWDVTIHNYLMKQNIVVPRNKKNSIDRIPRGAHVKSPTPGLYNWAVSFDLTSLYPHLIMGYNISPETLVGEYRRPLDIDKIIDGEYKNVMALAKEKNCSISAASCFFSKERLGFLPALMKDLFNKRKEYKDKMLELKKNGANENLIKKYDNFQQNIKIKLNSCYGALANMYFRWFDLRLAESITVSGQLTIIWAEKKLNEFMNDILKTENVDYVIASDTDSLYVNMEALVNQKCAGMEKKNIVDFLDEFCNKKVQPFLNEIFESLSEMMNCYEQTMHMKRETISERALFSDVKKRYALHVWDKEGVRYKTPELKITGFEAIRSSTPAWSRKTIKKAIETIMTQDEEAIIEYISEIRSQYDTVPFEEMASPRSINGIDKYYDPVLLYKKSTPIQVRGALVFNKFIKERKLKVGQIYDGDKIKFCYLKMPNPTRENVISCPDDIPADLEEFLDRELQFEKTTLEPIKGILDVIGWKTEKKNTVSKFFV